MADNTIALQVRSPNIDFGAAQQRYGNTLARIAQMQQADTVNQNAMLEQQQKQAVNDAYTSALNPDGSVDSAKLSQNLAQAGVGGQIPGAMKGVYDAKTSQNTSTKAQLETAIALTGQLHNIAANARTPEEATSRLTQLGEQFPQLSSEISQIIPMIPTDPALYPAFAREQARGMLSAKDRLEKRYFNQVGPDSQRIVGVDMYGDGPATEVPGSSFGVKQPVQYLRQPDGSFIPVPTSISTGGGASSGQRGGGAVSRALQTNPGAIKDGAFARSQPGYKGASGGFAMFDTPQAGVAAQENLLRGSYIDKGFNTIDKIVNRYAPQGAENSSASVSNYKKYIAGQTGIDINQPITAAQVPAVAKAMREFETGNRSGGNTGGGGAIEIGKPIGTPKPAASAITPEKKLARDTAIQNLYDLVVKAREAGHLVADEQSYIANRTQEARRGRTYLPGGTAQKTSLDSLEATTAQILRQFIQQGTSGTLNSNTEQALFLKSVGGADSTYDARMTAIRNFAAQNGVQLNDYARGGVGAAPRATKTTSSGW